MMRILDRSELQQICHKLQYHFDNEKLLIEALSHPSLHQHSQYKDVAIYERLEFLGDGILGMVISDLLFDKHAKDNEGQLAKRRAYLVSSEVLAGFATQLELAPHIIMTEGEEKNGGRENTSTLEDIMEAIIAAIYLDSDYSSIRNWIGKLWQQKILQDPPIAYDSKTMLQEWSQGHGLPIPHYEVLERSGSAHQPLFTITVQVPGHPEFRAQANSIKKAEKLAAQKMLEALGIIPSEVN